jgi:hypothetical protein
MFNKKWVICAFLFFICYLIIMYLDRAIEGFRGGGRGGGIGRGGIGRGLGYYGGRGYVYGPGYGYGGYYSSASYPIIVDDYYYPNYWYHRFLYPSYWYSYFN